MRSMRTRSILTLLVCTTLFCGCSRAQFADDIPCDNIVDTMLSTLDDGEEYKEFDSAQRTFYFEDSDEADDYCLVYSLDTNDINEIGIFHASDSDSAKDIAEDCREYVEDMQQNSRAFIASYAPEELTKLDGAQVRVYGNYVIYAILPPTQAEAAFDAAEKVLLIHQ